LGEFKTVKLKVGITAFKTNTEKHIIAVYTQNPKLGGKLITSGTASATNNFETQFR